jgi:prolyl 4-hydroxylase
VKVLSDIERRYTAASARQAWDEARHYLELGARAGDPFACGQLGVWHLLGHIVDRDDVEGFRLIDIAARAGEPDAQRLLATLYARGRGVHSSWTQAVEWLVCGARGGDQNSMRQLAFLLPAEFTAERRTLLDAAARAGDLAAQRGLAGMPRSSAAPTRIVWKKIKRAARRPSLPDGEIEVVREAPLIRMRHGVLSRELCDYLISAAGPYLTRARVNDPEQAERVHESRTNTFANFWLLEGDVVTDCVDRMLARLIGVSPAVGEPLSVLHYAPGEQFAPHVDYFDPDAPAHTDQLAVGGQRVATCLVYLNSEYEAGATAFIDIDLEIRGRPGSALFWSNVDANGAPERATRHAGLPPTSGEKWILSKWFRDRPQANVRAPVLA